MFDPHEQSRLIKQKATQLGFDLCGITRAEPSSRRDYYLNWIATGQHGRMHYMADRAEERLDPRVYFPAARSVVCVAVNYHISPSPPGGEGRGEGDAGFTQGTPSITTDKPAEETRRVGAAHDAAAETWAVPTLPTGSVTSEPPPHPNPLPRRERELGQIAKYARGLDYHTHVKDRLYDLADWIRDTFPEAQTKVGVDTVPVLERELAVKAGIGWQGKNSCVISPAIGSWIFLAEVLTSLDLPADEPETDHCGTCSRCIDACPTGAITAPYELDARKCISYLTIEHDGAIEPTLQKQMGDWLFGCDICQDVCPFNGRAPTAIDAFLQPRFASLNADTVANWTLDEYHSTTRRTALRRVKLPLFQRNARIVLENQS